MSSLKYWIWLSSIYGLGAAKTQTLLEHFGAADKVYNAAPGEYKAAAGIKAADIDKLSNKNLDRANEVLDSCARIGCRIVTIQDAEYPDRLKNIYDPPIILYISGTLPPVDEVPVVAIVGTRNCTTYGLKTAESISYQLAQSGFIIATGLAKGVDTAAARGALNAGGQVIGVIGSGIDVIYPPENKSLFAAVAKSGAIVSEYPPGTAAKAAHFPLRNRIISGFSLGVAVIEAPLRSGALITASRALEQGRDVFALPGNIDMKSNEGSNMLLREGAIPFMSADHIISEYAQLFPDKISQQAHARRVSHSNKSTEGSAATNLSSERDNSGSGKKEIDNLYEVEYIDIDKIPDVLSGDERIVAETIGRAVMHIDEIVANSGMTASQVLTALTMLEIKGHVSCGSGKHYKLIMI